MPRSRIPATPTILRARRLVDVDKGEYVEPGDAADRGRADRRRAPTSVPDDAR